MVREDADQLWRCTDAYKTGKSSFHAVELLRSYYLDVRGTIDTAKLPSGTEYAANLLFRFSRESSGFGLPKVSLEIGAETSNRNICLEVCGHIPEIAEIAMTPKQTVDGWMSVEIGRLFIPASNSGERKLLISLNEGRKVDRSRMSRGEEMEVLRWKGGLVIAGVIVKPTLKDRSSLPGPSPLSRLISACSIDQEGFLNSLTEGNKTLVEMKD